jgi:hypothetical protein
MRFLADPSIIPSLLLKAQFGTKTPAKTNRLAETAK